MSTGLAGILFLASLVIALVAVHVPLGDYMYRVYNTAKDSRAENVVYRLIGADPKAEQTWGAYARSVLAFSAVSLLFLFILQLVQGRLPSALTDPGTPMTPALAWNTAVSFVTNTNWQAYSGESTHGHLVQMAGLAVQNFVSAAVGMAVAIALVRGFARKRTGELGNFWVDLVRGTIRILLPISVIAAILLITGGAIQNFHNYDQVVNTLAGAQQTIPGGPVASQEAIKDLGTNGGGFYNVNSAHPFENPTTWTNWIEIFLLLVIAFSLPRTFGRMVGNKKQGYAIVGVQAVLAVISWSATLFFQLQAHGTVPTAVGAAMEGVEQRFGVANSAVFAASTTLTSTGSVDSFHDSYTSLGGLVLLFNMQLGEVAPGGVGAGLYGILILAVITVFVAGLMVGRTPEYLGKKITPREIKLAATYFLVTPLIVLTGTAVAMAMPGQRAGMLNTGPHGLSEVLYAFTSAANNNGSAFAGITVNTEWYNTALGLAMVFGRFLPIILALALAGSLAQQGKTPPSIGTLPTHRPQFVGMVAGVTLILVALTFLPMLALGPLAEGIH
ncbi:potassium-transporting ATPase subunit KdpA [Mycolicibacterium vanbaalenii]|uniref:Potassium-transporting ATPase potassium-binding subunit n=1 Tax=Mycolicibacterium vanbaalenii (strain DSM 7251 / JCM 13017 / BCRC 16820 / KCTC 9966 / NRRL B-24157 / PYR-1) TaxID=350058 RepID=KDPA_MYCVP|nr:potassium-transporting ATPase subunit KdpA [Mycolicibacterium vanbaalenii]A1TED2.1 RecName: Full=Potassium-transporting ATPase potassium-binding subunit; AltName: Full=ATP phosphohydrolase [potassium-transporting] A chain; AltName: Full=Potassium-binding and translocating subunit A; AltName: Full=Potassium-translocating ATPase A chain [Mycolicibacterium vanbaalenii PYR-1]ABM15532.1 potassium-transporting ATPase, A subunit [Mycolicibacterium vanbaalenii PYR-1]MCV7130913.1 potassium-transportin